MRYETTLQSRSQSQIWSKIEIWFLLTETQQSLDSCQFWFNATHLECWCDFWMCYQLRHWTGLMDWMPDEEEEGIPNGCWTELLGQGLSWWLSTGWPREHRDSLHLCSPRAQKRWTQGWPTLGSCKGQILKGEHPLGLSCFLRRSAAWPESAFTSGVHSTLCSVCDYWPAHKYFTWYHQQPVRTNCPSSWAERMSSREAVT